MNDAFYIQRCIDLALKGKGNTAPNPMVGAVIVHDGVIIGEGFHKQYGEAHAEVNAVNSVKDQSLLPESTIYVSLEPCAHFGKTPPCSDLIVHHRFKRVVVGCIDTFSEVSGKGIQRIRTAGIEVTTGVLEQECRELNKRFFTFHEQKRPYIILKWAQTPDGFMDQKRTPDAVGINWITQPETKQLVHQWRTEEAAILVGKQTATNDNPRLTAREATGKNPVRILLDSNLEVPENAAIFSKEAPTLVFNLQKSGRKDTIEWIRLEKIIPETILPALFEKNIQSVIIEGGKTVLESFIAANLWDEARILIGTENFREGLTAPELPPHQSLKKTAIGRDTLIVLRK